MSDTRVLADIVSDIVTATLEANLSLHVNAECYTDHKGRAASAVWIGEDITFDATRRFVEVVLNVGGLSENDASISTWDRDKNEAESGNPNMAKVTSSDMWTDTSGAAKFLVHSNS